MKNPILTDEELISELERRFKENKKMVSELQLLTEELKVANKKLEESESMKSHFISNITNEIINPFTTIIGMAKTILTVEKESWKTVISMVSHIYSEAFNLDFQFRNIFVAAKIEAGEITPEICKVDIKSLIDQLLDSFKIEAKKKGIQINLNFNIKNNEKEIFYFKTDPEKFKLILSNLISNAIKFSSEKSKVELNVWLEKNTLLISVKDYGEGISEENIKIIFDRFQRVDTGISSLNRGHGLGLSINKALLDLLEGKIDIKTKKGEGSLFTVSIPESTASDSNIIAFSDNELYFNEGDKEEVF